jgi:hypothetical protein
MTRSTSKSPSLKSLQFSQETELQQSPQANQKIKYVNWANDWLNVIKPIYISQDIRIMIDLGVEMELIPSSEKELKMKIDLLQESLLAVEHKEWPWATQPTEDHVRKRNGM